MILTKRVAMNGQQLDELDPSIVIRSVEPGVPKEAISAVDRMYGTGQRITSRHWQTLETVVSWAMNIPKRNLAERRRVFELVTKWAIQGGWLTSNMVPDRMMYVEKAEIADGGDLWQWTNEYKITFRAYGVPFWQGATPATGAAGGASGGVWIDAGGQIRTVADADVYNSSGMPINNLALTTTSGGVLIFAGLNLPGYWHLYVQHGNDGVLRVTDSTGASRMNCLMIQSSDMLYAGPGPVGMSHSADRGVTVSYSARGRYL